ncbi:MAG: hypothetical protein ACKOEI_08110, partial [Chthoniobacterales bacterium]
QASGGEVLLFFQTRHQAAQESGFQDGSSVRHNGNLASRMVDNNLSTTTKPRQFSHTRVCESKAQPEPQMALRQIGRLSDQTAEDVRWQIEDRITARPADRLRLSALRFVSRPFQSVPVKTRASLQASEHFFFGHTFVSGD